MVIKQVEAVITPEGCHYRLSDPLLLLLPQHFSELLDDLSQDALLGQLLSDPFLSGGRCGMEAMEGDLSPSSPLPPHITAEHSYSLCGDSRPQSPLSHLTGEQGSEAGERSSAPALILGVVGGRFTSNRFLPPQESLRGIQPIGRWSRRTPWKASCVRPRP